MGTIEFDVRHPNGKRETISIEGERALVGSGSHCDVRLPMEDAAYEHALIETFGASASTAGDLRARALAAEPPVTIDEVPLTLAPLPPGAVLGIGRVKLLVTRVGEFGPSQGARVGSGTGGNPLAALALLAVFGTAGYLLLLEDEERIAPPPAEAPALFASAPQSCPPGDATRALGLAEEHLAQAEGKRERLPFALESGVSAVAFYETAAACFRRAGAEARAVDADEAAAGLERDLTDELRTRALRLSQMLKVQDYELARTDVTVLRALTNGKRGKYVDWLSTVSKQLAKKGSR
jgi:hypothetical protein